MAFQNNCYYKRIIQHSGNFAADKNFFILYDIFRRVPKIQLILSKNYFKNRFKLLELPEMNITNLKVSVNFKTIDEKELKIIIKI